MGTQGYWQQRPSGTWDYWWYGDVVWFVMEDDTANNPDQAFLAVLLADTYSFGWSCTEFPTLEAAQDMINQWIEIYGHHLPRKVIPIRA